MTIEDNISLIYEASTIQYCSDTNYLVSMEEVPIQKMLLMVGSPKTKQDSGDRWEILVNRKATQSKEIILKLSAELVQELTQCP